MRHRLLVLLVLLASSVVLPACQTLQEIANLRRVDFDLDRVTDAYLAGVRIDRLRSYQDLTPGDLLRLGAAISREELPLEFVLHLNALNPADNQGNARLVRMDWTLFLEGRETVSGLYDDQVILPPGQPRDVPIGIGLDLVDFFGSNLRDLVDLALSVAGQGGAPKEIRLRATPTIDTPFGPIRYPEPVTIVSREVGR